MGSGCSCWNCDGPMVVYHRPPSRITKKPKHEASHGRNSSWMLTAQDAVPNHDDQHQLPHPNHFPHGHRENPLLAGGSEVLSVDPTVAALLQQHHYYSALLAEESRRGDVGSDDVQSPFMSGDHAFDLHSIGSGANVTARDGGCNAVAERSSFRGSCAFEASSCSAEAMLAPSQKPERLSAEIGSSGSGHHQRQQHIPRSPGLGSNRPGGDSTASQPTATSSQTRVTFLDDPDAGDKSVSVHASSNSRLGVQLAAVRRVSAQVPSVVFLNDMSMLAADMSAF